MEKITITPLDSSGNPIEARAFKVLFNPASYSVSKSLAWSPVGDGANRGTDAPALTFNGGGSRVLSLELFYDITEAPSDGAPQFIFDVRTETNRMVDLTRIRADNSPPPVVEISWGDSGPRNSDFPFQGVVSSLNQTFTLFEDDGTPLRATLSVSFTEFYKKPSKVSGFNLKTVTRMVRAGDRLTSLAGVHLNDPAAWRSIAKANEIDDPRRLTVGQRLAVPKT